MEEKWYREPNRGHGERPYPLPLTGAVAVVVSSSVAREPYTDAVGGAGGQNSFSSGCGNDGFLQAATLSVGLYALSGL